MIQWQSILLRLSVRFFGNLLQFDHKFVLNKKNILTAPTTLNPSTNISLSLSFVVAKNNDLAFEIETDVSFIPSNFGN
jgi:hypothetical protein